MTKAQRTKVRQAQRRGKEIAEGILARLALKKRTGYSRKQPK